MDKKTILINILNSANDYFEKGNYIYAKQIYESLLNKIKNKKIYYNLGICLYNLKKYDEAIIIFKKVILLDPSFKDTYNNMGICYKNLKQYDKAIEHYKKAIDLDKNFVEVYYNWGICLDNLKKYDDAIILYNKVVQLRPTYVNVYNNLGQILYKLNKYNEAIKNYNIAIQLNPNFYITYYNVGLLNLKKKDFIKGFEYNEYRLIIDYMNIITTDYTILPQLELWDGKIKINKLLICCEHGIGDIFQFMRYILELSDIHPELYIDFIVPSKIYNLLYFYNKNKIKIIKNIKSNNISLYDKKLWLMSIPHILKINKITPFNIENLYIKIYNNKVIEWKEKFQNFLQKKVAICWKGNVNMLNIEKHIPLTLFNKISNLDIDIISLQKGDGEEELNNIDFKIHSFCIDNNNSFEDTIAILNNIDLVITVDTSIVHLAGLLGVKTWLILDFVSDWRWFQDEKKTDWYESVELFRNKTIGDWTEVLEEVENKLKTELKNEINNKIPNKMHNTIQYELTDKEITIPKIPISIGELFDKFSILDIKMEKIKEPEKLTHVKTELEYLKPYLRKYDITEELYTNLKNVNKSLWDIEDKLRIKEKNKEFDDGFIKLSRSVYFTNDKRSEIKKSINIFFNSNIVEVKEYTDYK